MIPVLLHGLVHRMRKITPAASLKLCTLSISLTVTVVAHASMGPWAAWLSSRSVQIEDGQVVDRSHFPVDRTGTMLPLKNLAVMQRSDPYWISAKREFEAPRPATDARTEPRIWVIYGGPTGAKKIALTFDDGPKEPNNSETLAALRAVNVRATFFLVGKMVRRYPEGARAIAVAGHEIANHSFSHATLSQVSYEDASVDYMAANLAIRDACGVTPVWCRPPGGKRDHAVYRAASRAGLKTALWTSDPLDFQQPAQDVLLGRMVRDLQPGAVYLLHNGARQTFAVLPDFVRIAHEQGYEFVTLSELFSEGKPSAASARP